MATAPPSILNDSHVTAADVVTRLRHALSLNVLRVAWIAWLVVGALFLVGTAWALRYSATHLPAAGMRVHVYRGADFAGEAMVINRDPALDPAQAARASGLDSRQPFSLEWDGVAVATEDGIHHIRVRTDDGVAVWLNDQLLIEHFVPGRHDLSAAVQLARGLHRLRIRYAQYGDDAYFRLFWARPSWREHFAPVIVVPPTPELIYRRVDKALAYPTVVAVAWSLWIACGLALAFCASCAHLARRSLARHFKPAAALAVVAVILLGFGIHLGAAPWRGWVPDELTPDELLHAAQEGFAGGWYFLYPPLQFYLVNLVTSPFLLLAHGGWLDVGDYDIQATMHVVSRMISVIMGALTLLVVAMLAALTIGQRLTILAPFFLLTAPPFIFYSKTTNVDIPYVFWVSVAMLLFVRALTTRSLLAHVLLGAAVALAVTTKDQAYGFFPGAAAVLAWYSWSETASLGTWTARMRATVLDRRLWAGAGTCVVVFILVMGVPWNVDGAIAHFELIRRGSQAYRMFPPTLDGMRRLTVATAALLPSALGLVCTVFAAVGLGVVLTRPRRYRLLVALLSLVISYLVSFVAVAGYIYDRFFLGVALLASLLAAVGFDTTMRTIRMPRARSFVTVGLLLLALLPSFLLNVRIYADSRRQLEAWMKSHIDSDLQVIGSGPRERLPNLHPFRHLIETRLDGNALLEWDADVFVLNEQWLNRAGDSNFAAVAQSLEHAGYQRVFSAGGDPTPSTWTALFNVGLPAGLFSNLDEVSPPLSVWQRLP